jgi:hypothetical protein
VTEPAELEGFKALWRDVQDRMASVQPAPMATAAEIQPVPKSLADELDAIKKTDAYRRGYEPYGGTFASIPLAGLVVPQWWVDVDYMGQLATGVPVNDDYVGLLRYSFPAARLPKPTIVGGGMAMLSSRRRTLDMPSPLRVDTFDGDHATISFDLFPRPNFIWISVTQTGALLIVNGVHRLLTMLRGGHSRAFALVRSASVEETLLNFSDPGIIKPNRLMALRPPLLQDYLDDLLATTVAVNDYDQLLRLAIQSELGYVPAA